MLTPVFVNVERMKAIWTPPPVVDWTPEREAMVQNSFLAVEDALLELDEPRPVVIFNGANFWFE